MLKFMVLNKWKVDLQVKKLKVDISATPRKSSVAGPYHHPQGRNKLLIPPIKHRQNVVSITLLCNLLCYSTKNDLSTKVRVRRYD